MPKKRVPPPTMTDGLWRDSIHPGPMIAYLENSGCYLEFEAFFMDCFDRIRHEFHTRAIIDAVYHFDTDVDGLVESARVAIEKLSEQLSRSKLGSREQEELDREIRFSKSVLAREYHDFGEANRYLSNYLIEIADDPTIEAKAQADCLRANFEFPFVSTVDEDF